jgi:hypothetical protein
LCRYTAVDMINQHVIPSCKKAELPFVKKLEDSVKTLKKAVDEIHAAADESEVGRRTLCIILAPPPPRLTG